MFGVFLIGKQPHQKLDGAFTVKQVSRKLDEIAADLIGFFHQSLGRTAFHRHDGVAGLKRLTG